MDVLIQKANDIKEKYNSKNHKNYKEILEELLSLDVKRYGSSKALTLNWKLSLFPLLPLGNLIYARDQMNVLFSKRVKAYMKKEIRRPEVDLYEVVYQRIFNSKNHTLMLPEGETFEGGDAYIHDKTIYVGVGARTSLGAAKHIYKELYDQINELSYNFIIVEDPNANKRSHREQMLFMHLDTFSNPVGKRQIAVCLSEAKKRKVKTFKKRNGKIVVVDLNKTFLDYLFEDGQVIVSIPEEEQQTFGCNFLAIDEKTILVPLQTNKKTIEGLESIGKKVHYVPLDESTKGFGAAHCMTGQLFRKARLTGKTL
jgi:arginine deiminase